MSISPYQSYKKEENVALMFFCIEQFILDQKSYSIVMKSVFISPQIFCSVNNIILKEDDVEEQFF